MKNLQKFKRAIKIIALLTLALYFPVRFLVGIIWNI